MFEAATLRCAVAMSPKPAFEPGPRPVADANQVYTSRYQELNGVEREAPLHPGAARYYKEKGDMK